MLRAIPLLSALALLLSSTSQAALVSAAPASLPPASSENASTAFLNDGSESRIGLLCHNDPINKSDPTGENPIVWAAVGLGALGAGIDLAAQSYLVHIGAQDHIDRWSVVFSGLAGATGVGLSAVTDRTVLKLGLTGVRAVATRTAMNSAGSAAIGAGAKVADNVANGNDAAEGVARSAITNLVLGGVGSLAEEGVGAATEKVPLVGAGNALGTAVGGTVSSAEPLLPLLNHEKDGKK